MRLALSVIVTGVLASGMVAFATAEGDYDYAHNLMVLTNPSIDYRESVEKRYRFIMPKIAERCTDIESAEVAADMVFYVHTRLDEAGLGKRENLLALTETLYRTTVEAAQWAEFYAESINCDGIFGTYLHERENGKSPVEASQLVTNLATLKYKLRMFDEKVLNK